MKKTFEVKIKSDNGKSETVFVEAETSWKAQTSAMMYCTTKFCTSKNPQEVPTLTYEVKEIV